MPLNVSFCEIAQFYDWNRGDSHYLQDNPILDLVTRFEAKESGYQTACLKTKAYLLGSLKQSRGKLCYEMIKQGHRCITAEVEGLPSDMQPGELTLETMLFFQDTNGGMIPSQDMKKIYSKDPLMLYISHSDRVYKLGRKKVTHTYPIQSRIERTIEKFNKDILKAKKQIDKARIIYNTCQQLEILHPFADGNCRLFIMTLMNVLREIHGLPVIAFSDPNLVDTLSFNDMNNFEGLVFNVPDLEPSDQEIRSIIYKSVVAHSFVDNLRNPNIYKRKWTTAQMESIFFTNNNITKYRMDEDEITLGRHNLLSTAPDDVGNQLQGSLIKIDQVKRYSRRYYPTQRAFASL